MLSASVLFALMALFVRMASARGAHWSVVAFARTSLAWSWLSLSRLTAVAARHGQL
jgi:hypothetical protein